MKTSQFKTFIETIKTAPANADIWYCGYLFLNLTQRQGQIFLDELAKNPIVKNGRNIFDNTEYLEIPSGMRFYLNK